jgi:hypothetical protein
MTYVWNSTGCDLNTTMVENVFPNLVTSTYVGPCPSVPHIDRDENRIPKHILTYHCGECHKKSCSKQGDFNCQEIKHRISVEIMKGERSHREIKSFPIGCVCMSHVSKRGNLEPEPEPSVT